MQLRARIDLAAFPRNMQQRSRRIAFSVAQALNETAKQIQTAQRERLRRIFTLRRAATARFLERQIKISQFASARLGIPYAVIEIEPRPRLLLPRFERGGRRRAFSGRQRVAVPLTGGPARPSFTRPVPPSLFITRLELRPRRTSQGKTQWKGQRRTFLIRGLGVFQRVGRRTRAAVRILYTFATAPLLKPVLRFAAVAASSFRQHWSREWMRARTRKKSAAS